jgi:undecaprenyl diphosphate synthase
VKHVPSESVPQHLGLILDGNRRWARAKGLPTLEGHRAGYENLKTIGLAGLERGIKFVSAYCFSTENWNRSKEEVDYLMRLLLWVAKHEVEAFHKENVRIRFLGSREKLSAKILKAIDEAEAKTAGNTRGTLALCINYGGHQELVDATRALIEKGIKAAEVTAENIAEHLYGPEIPPLDLIIRTSGEQRLSNFMLWRAAYSELYFTDVHWPDFDEGQLDIALGDYASRQRRFGK